MSTADRYQTTMKSLGMIDADWILRSWKRRTFATQACFGEYEAEKSGTAPGKKEGVDRETVAVTRPKPGAWRTVVFLSYENPKGMSGGILAVIRRLPAEMRRNLGTAGKAPDLIRLSPHHTRLKSTFGPGQLVPITDCDVPFDGCNVKVTVSKVTFNGDEEWHVFGAEGFFEADGGVGGKDPYIHGYEDQQMRDGDESRLLRDSLFACKAVPIVLKALKKTCGLIIHAQDWEFASAALTVKEAIIDGGDGDIKSAAVVLTLHNPYDHSLSETNLARFTKHCNSRQWPAIGGQGRPTVLTRMIPLLDAPVSVVSHQFAKELTEEPIQTGVFTGHQQGVLRYQGLVGIDNGDFGQGQDAPFTPTAVANARNGAPTEILQEKAVKRTAMLEALTEYLGKVDPTNPETLTVGTLAGEDGKPLVDLPPSVPVFMMVGRLDPGQKGYDVCAQLIRLLPRGTARFVLTPMSPLAEDAAICPFFGQLKQLARQRPGEVVVFAHRMDKAYKETLAGATYGLWPSRYEPFGGANEFYEKGTPVIAHAVGGLVQQVVGYATAPLDATGFLYDARPAGVSRVGQEKEYRDAHEALPLQRMSMPVYRLECEALHKTVLSAIDVFQHDPQAYGIMLSNLLEILRELRWDKPVKDYLSWYDKACS
jgi:glycogen synthase